MARLVGLLRPGCCLLLLPLLFASLEADAEAGQAKTSAVFRRNNHDTSEAVPSPYYPNNYSRYRRQFSGARDESDAASFSGFPGNSGGFDTFSSLRSSGQQSFSAGRKGGSRNLPPSRGSLPFPGLGGPDSLLISETTESPQEDDSAVGFRGSGGFPGFPSPRDSRGFGNGASGASKGGSRGRNNSPQEGTSSAFNFPGSAGGSPFGSPSSTFGSQPSRGSYKTGTSSFNAPPSFNGALSSASDPFPVPGGFGPNSGFPSPNGLGPIFGGSSFPSSNNNRFPSSGSGNKPFSSSNDPFPVSGGLSFLSPGGAGNDPFPVPGGLSFPSPGGLDTDPFPSVGNSFPSPVGNGGRPISFQGSGSAVNFPGAVYSGRTPFQPGGGGSGPLSVGNALPIDANLLAALKGNQDLSNLGINLDELMGLEPTTTKPPLRVASDEDRDKIFSGGPASGGFGSPPDTTGRKGGRPPAPSAQRVPETKAIAFTGGCGEEPEAPVNGLLQCSSYAGCRAGCERGYRFPTGESRLFVACEEGRWEVRGGPWTTIPPCEPECVPACQNAGICLQPNVCSCPDNWEGAVCDQPKAPLLQQECSDKPPTPMNSRIFCSKEECIAKCHEKFEFSEGVVRLFFDCVGGNWVIRDEQYTSVPDCIATCDPDCINGGRCIAPDICECTPDYRGDHCQYPITNCEAKKLGFNGGYNCSGEGMEFGCKLWCPEDVPFKFPAAERYECDYATGRWSPLPIPDCDYETAFGAFETGSVKFGSSLVEVLESEGLGSIVNVRPLRRHPGVCFTWSGMHYKSFDGRVYSFEGNCPYTLIQDAALGTFSVNLIPEHDCPQGRCPRALRLFLEGDEYTLSKAASGQPTLVFRDTSLAIPGQLNGLVTERVAHFVVLKLVGMGLTVKWDLQNLVITEVSEVLWNRTAGLCGLLDGVESNDWAYADGSSETQMATFLKAWEATTLGESCTSPPVTRSPCAGNPLGRRASDFCSKLISDPRFAQCRELVDVTSFVEACKWDYCSCHENPSDCACASFSSFFRECTNKGGEVEEGWRTASLCPMDCGFEREYKSCMPAIEPRCGQAADTTNPEFCVEGCDCPQGSVLMEGKCVSPNDCPCTYHNKTYSTGDTIPNDCNSCTCVGGEWKCTEVKCGSRCASVGDPHYTTFDGRRYDFMGKCSYYLVKGSDYSIEAENTPCAGAISEAMNFPASVVSQFPSCTKSVTISASGTVIKLKQDREVVINGIETPLLPVWVNDIYVKRASNLFVVAELPNGLDVWWDGQTRAYVDAPPEMRGAVSGLCGTFTDNQKDDFLTPEGDVEQNHIAFANKWKTSDKCDDMPLTEETHPCDRHVQNKDVAEKYCTKIKSYLFSDCHLNVDPEPHYADCMYDLCSCEADLASCMCPIFAAYSQECARKGVLVDWRTQIRECGVHCKGGQQYQVCGDSCSHSCYDLATNPGCKRRCVEGCNCPEGFTLDAGDKCVPISQCPCVYLGKEYKAEYEMMQPSATGDRHVCECMNAQWQCRQPTLNELESERFFELPQVGCLEENHETYTDCMPDEEPTCKTMHFKNQEQVSDTCKAGCRCQEGFVRDTDSGRCVSGSECPCHHGGKSYAEQETMVEECNTCTCSGGEWACTTKECPGMCTAWGDSHFKTFDGKIFEFHGTCDYMLAKAKSKGADSFQVTIQNVPCGTNGVTCAKSITLRVGARDNQEVIELSKDKPHPSNSFSRTIIREAGVFVFAEVPDMGLVLQWDKGTRAYLTLDNRWKGNVKGLCGNYNDDEQDDYQTPSGGTAEASARIFGDSWRLQNYCPESTVIEDTCSLHPQRKVWATEKCAVLKSSVFSPCHSEVPVDPYVSRCQFDSCGCDTGGDCECLCTALAAYAHECNIHGVYVSWRTQDLCPMQCDQSCEHYEPCIPTCPTQTCDTLLEAQSSTCLEATCVEGCAKDVCPPGQVHKSATDKECIPEPECDKKCLEIDGKVYMEGDLIVEDDCHTCFCTRKKKVCRGSPCTTTPSYIPTSPRLRVTTPMPEQTTTPTPPPSTACKSGWTVWVNRDHPIAFKKTSDEEALPERIVMTNPSKGHCSSPMFADIRCRVVGSHESWDSTGQGVRCTLEEGLSCRGRAGKGAGPQVACKDYEIALLCDCGKEVIETTPLEKPVTAPPLVEPSTLPSVPDLPETCAEEWTPWMNRHVPTEYGEFETLEGLRPSYSFCPKHFIKEVECRNADGSALRDYVKCDLTGATCRNNANGNVNLRYCFDTEVRVLCQCKCQDGLGMADGSIPDSAITSSNPTITPGAQDTAPRARLEAFDESPQGGGWVVPARSPWPLSAMWLQVDLGERKEVTGVDTQGSPRRPDLFVSEFSLQVSADGSKWGEIRDEGADFAKRFSGNSDGTTTVTNLLPTPVMVRFVRLVPLSVAPRGGVLRLEIKGCDHPVEQELTSLAPWETTEPPLLHETHPIEPVCVDGWTSWMNSHTPIPGDWDDIENYSGLRQKFAFCEESMIVGTECQVAVMRTPADRSGQNGVVCSHNLGLQCIDDLQAPAHCLDYEIRFMCDCSKTTPTTMSTTGATRLPPLTRYTTPPVSPPDVEEIGQPCQMTVPASAHKTSCVKFYECQPTSGSRGFQVEKTCGPGTMFNPETFTCTWPASVVLVRPECAYPDLITTPSTDERSATPFTPPRPGVTPPPPRSVACEDTWTEWFNESHPSEGSGDYETYGAIKARHPDLCDAARVAEAQCQFYKLAATELESPSPGRGRKGGRKGRKQPTQIGRYTSALADYTESEDTNVVCSSEGLTCDNLDQGYGRQCQDYTVRFLCSCDPAKVSTPALPPYTDVRNSSVTSDERMYNDWCPPGRSLKDQAIPCARICLYYGRVLAQSGHCTSRNDYAPACADDETGVVCPPGMFLRDKANCVAIFDCNCYLPNGVPAPPGKTFLVSDCEVCMCENNQLKCDRSACLTTPLGLPSPPPGRELKKFECDNWGPWLNEHTPGPDGERELLLELRDRYPDLCADPVSVECVTVPGNQTALQAGQNVECSTSVGLQCRSDRNFGGCLDYKIRFYCLCDVPDTTYAGLFTTTAPPKVSPFTPSPLPPLPGCFQPFWTEWFNTSHPSDEDGDYEMIDDIAAQGLAICPKAYIEEIECVYNREIVEERGGAATSKGGRGERRGAKKGKPQRLTAVRYEETDYASSDDVYVVCSRDVGLTCVNMQQPRRGRCHDYAVRVYCSCEPVERPPPGIPSSTPVMLTTPSTPYPGWPVLGPECEPDKQMMDCAAPCDRVCMLYKTYLNWAGRCESDSECAPGCGDPIRRAACPPGLYMQDNSTCVAADECSCKLPSGQPLPAGREFEVSACEVCRCVNNQLACSTKPGCVTTQTTLEPFVGLTVIPTVSGKEKTTPGSVTVKTTPVYTAPPVPPIQIRCNEWTPWLNMKRNSEGDFQRISELREREEFSDLCETPMNVSCREANAKLPASQLGQVLTCDSSVGLVCRNRDNSQDCYDYEVAFFCACEEGDETPGLEEGVTTPVVGLVTVPAPCNAWSPWVNEQKPWLGNGDTERKTLAQMRDEFGFCSEGELADIECHSTVNGGSPPDVGTLCDLRYGFQCKNSDQVKGACYDYRIRYYCSCETTPATTTLVMVPITPTPPTICNPDDYTNLLEDVPDWMLAASSSINTYFGPDQVRLSNPTARGWAPRDSTPGEYLQVTLIAPQTVYGFMVAGSPNTADAVEVFTVDLSYDGSVWMTVTDNPEDSLSPVRYFRGPPRGSNLPVTQLLPQPKEVSFIRVKPITWNNRPVMRLEVLGCEVPLTTRKPTKIEICIEPMGLENGALDDDQITVSSVLNDQPFYGKGNSRLNFGGQRSVSAGAWVPENKPDQYIRFDFLEPSKLSGVVIQGRADQDEWVETFNIRYSPDLSNWNALKDPETGEDKVFYGNMDRNSPVENSFGRVVETRYLELRPLTWRGAPALRVEVKGCFHPYTRSPLEATTQTTPLYPTHPPPAYCRSCPQLPPVFYSRCRPCRPNLFYDGTDCVPNAMCPCYKNGVKYQVGAIFETTDCKECTCELGGAEACQKKACPPCPVAEEHGVLTANCDCLCKPCAAGTRLCPSSNYCINQTQWCDGIENCLDDEKDCPTTTTPIPAVPGCPMPSCPGDWRVTVKRAGDATRCPVYDCDPPVLTTPANCPHPACPLGFDIHLRPQKNGLCPIYDCVLPSSTFGPPTCPPPSCPDGYEVIADATDFTNDDYELQQSSDEGCPQYKCATSSPPTAPCPMPQCQDGYDINFSDTKELLKPCPAFECIPTVTTTVCPPVACVPGLRTLILNPGEGGACPQFTCIKITTPAMPVVTTPTVPLCGDVALPVCEPGEEFYQKNPNEMCPVFGCKPIGGPPPTPGAPQVVAPECEMDGRSFDTFDGTDFKLETCNHVLARKKRSEDWLISVHRNCSSSGTCERYLSIKQEDHQLLLNPDLDITWDTNSYSVSQMQKIGSQTNTFTVSRQGNSLYVQSLQHKYYVVWDVNMNVKIGVDDTLLYEVDGLCGFYTGSPGDDKTKPDGSIASNTEDYGNSWALDEDKCEQPKCTPDTTAAAFQLCNTIDSLPFSLCRDKVPAAGFLPGCVESVCDCLSSGGAVEDCKCTALAKYVTKCLEVDRTVDIQNWRVVAKCYKECPSGERYSDCHPVCEKTCGTLKKECPELPSAKCSTGCFCDPGLVRKDGRCVHPDLCGDCICEGYGDPHYKTFDRHNFTFNGECSYVAARHRDPRGNHKFQVITHNKRCNRDPVTMCTDEVKLIFEGHTALVRLLPTTNLLVLVDGATLSTFPHRVDWLAVEKPDEQHVALAVPSIHLQLTYSAENYGFTVTIPSHLFFNETEGLCGNCNSDDTDDLKLQTGGHTENVEDFGLSWQVREDSPGVCEIFKKEDIPCLPLPPDEDPCLQIMEPAMFGECHPLEDPVAYVSSCQQDVCLSRDPADAACQSLGAYAKRCAQLDVCLQWRKEDFCPITCPAGLEYKLCGPGCVKTCDNFEEIESNLDSCPFAPSDGCFCPDGTVLQDEQCVNKTQCKACDDEGHREGDAWQKDVCTRCECQGGAVHCTKASCPQDPVCDSGYNLLEIPFTGDACCGPKKKCELKPPSECPRLTPPGESCGHGKTHQLIRSGRCSEYACVCVAPEDCPQLETPDPALLKPGEDWLLNEQGCCPKYSKACTGDCPVLDCQEFYELKTKPKPEDMCCPEQSCEHPADVCIYEPKAQVPRRGPSKTAKGRPMRQEAAPAKLRYQIGEAWQDGPCVECECAVDAAGVPYHNCVRQSCPTLDQHPDRVDYELRPVNTSGQCCPGLERHACIDDTEIIAVGEELPDPINGCRSVSCERKDAGRVEKVEKMLSCDESCADGWRYSPSDLYPQVCCGSCEQVDCVHEGVTRQPDDEWTSEDHCISYRCVRDVVKGSLETRAVEVQCEKPTEVERTLYEFVSFPVPDMCCPEFTRTQCLVEGAPLPVGKSIPDPRDPCVLIECVLTPEGTLLRKEKEQACTNDCNYGSTYYNPPAGSDACCGRCIQTHCVDDGLLHEVGANWESSDDICYQFTCQIRDDVLTTVAVKRECPYFNPQCPESEVYTDPSGCCRLCNITITPKRDCKAEPMDPKETVGMFMMENRNFGVCRNEEPVALNMCRGHCDSSTMYKLAGRVPQLENECYCCQPSEYEQIPVILTCNTGSFNVRRYNIKSCTCIPCSQDQALKDQPIVDETEFISRSEESVQN